MNIIDAAKVLKDGKKIKRPHWVKEAFIDGNEEYIVKHFSLSQDRTLEISIGDLEAVDWEIYEEQSPMEKSWQELKAETNKATPENKIFFEAGWEAHEHFTNKD